MPNAEQEYIDFVSFVLTNYRSTIFEAGMLAITQLWWFPVNDISKSIIRKTWIYKTGTSINLSIIMMLYEMFEDTKGVTRSCK